MSDDADRSPSIAEAVFIDLVSDAEGPARRDHRAPGAKGAPAGFAAAAGRRSLAHHSFAKVALEDRQ